MSFLVKPELGEGGGGVPYLNMELLLRQLDSLDDMAICPAFQRVDEGCVLEEEGTQLEVGDCLLPLHAATTGNQ